MDSMYTNEEDSLCHSRKHVPSNSDAKDEYTAAFHCAIWNVWLRFLLTEVHSRDLVEDPTIMVGDNQHATT